ncbi:DNA primase [Runella sp. SP2]|uniref:DNA primase n=1 Tax=Runella sp. SP2 TaxID=2268026 RepID=UPI000F080C80|nr:DNA primase [Runella sp. SP2]AYQ32095.1 DNA primase [Runella sp. SP2]
MRISNDTADRIKQTADIVEVIGDFVSLKKRGANYIACCPFHNEKSPSFNVNPVRQIYKCFGCGAAGDSVKFVMDIEGVSYGEALRHLAQKYHIEVEEEQQTPEEVLRQNERDSLYIVLNFAQKHYQKLLIEHEEGQAIGLSYFRNRGFNDPTIKSFGLGYSLNEWDNLTKEAAKRGYNPDLLQKAGLALHKEGNNDRYYDRFRGRVIFPIHNVSGKVIAFGARILTNDKNQPKYINSPETDVYHKSKVLYGIHQAKNAIRQEDVCYLVEGYTDVISLHQAGIQNVVASSGTSLTEDQIKLIARFTQNITILYDGDAAGIKAALRGLDMVLEEGLNVSLVTLPDGEDPDSYVYSVGAEGFKAHVKKATKDFITFKTEMLLRDAGDNPFKRAEAINEIVASITKIPDPIKRQIFFRRTADLMKMDEQTLISEGNKYLRQQQEKAKPAEPRQSPRRQQSSPSQPPPPPKSSPPMEPDGMFFSDTFIEEEFGILVEDNFAEPLPNIPKETPKLVTELPNDLFKTRLYLQEQAFVRLLILYGQVELEAGISLCRYLLHEIGEITFETPLFNLILEIFRQRFNFGEVPSTDYFLGHLDPDVQRLTIDLCTNSHHLSENWQKYEIVVPTDEDLLHEIAFKKILRLKMAYSADKMKDLMNQLGSLSGATDEEFAQIMDIQKQYRFFKNINDSAAKELGTVVPGY